MIDTIVQCEFVVLPEEDTARKFGSLFGSTDAAML